MEELKKIDHPSIKEVRGRGLFIGVELTEAARPYCEELKELGLLCKETHDTVIRFAPPLVITKEELGLGIRENQKSFCELINIAQKLVRLCYNICEEKHYESKRRTIK